MTFKELAEQTLKGYPEGIWVHFQECGSEIYLDEYYLKEFENYLDREVLSHYIDDFAYEVLEVTLKD